jgi:hypothetical protein
MSIEIEIDVGDPQAASDGQARPRTATLRHGRAAGDGTDCAAVERHSRCVMQVDPAVHDAAGVTPVARRRMIHGIKATECESWPKAKPPPRAGSCHLERAGRRRCGSKARRRHRRKTPAALSN